MKFSEYSNLWVTFINLKNKEDKIKNYQKKIKEYEIELSKKTNENKYMLLEFNKIIKERDIYKYQLEKIQKEGYIIQKDNRIQQL